MLGALYWPPPTSTSRLPAPADHTQGAASQIQVVYLQAPQIADPERMNGDQRGDQLIARRFQALQQPTKPIGRQRARCPSDEPD